MSDDRLARLVHDVRTPLAIVIGFSELLESRAESLTPEQRADYVARIRSAAEEMSALLDSARS
jgi:signal transduction histidine kinase